MNFFHKISLVKYLFCFVAFPAMGSVHDFRIWTYQTISGSFNKCFDLYFENTQRFRDNGRHFFYLHEQFDLIFHVKPWLDITPAYRQSFFLVDPEERLWATEYQPNLSITFFKVFCNWKWSNRSRFAYRVFENGPHLWQYRNRILAEPTWSLTCYEIRPYISNEIFVERKSQGIYQNRFACGLRFKIAKKLSGDIGYLRQTVKEIEWHNNDVLTLFIRAHF